MPLFGKKSLTKLSEEIESVLSPFARSAHADPKSPERLRLPGLGRQCPIVLLGDCRCTQFVQSFARLLQKSPPKTTFQSKPSAPHSCVLVSQVPQVPLPVEVLLLLLPFAVGRQHCLSEFWRHYPNFHLQIVFQETSATLQP